MVVNRKEFTEIFVFVLLDAIFLFLVLKLSIFFRSDVLNFVFKNLSPYSTNYDLTLVTIFIPLWLIFLMYEGVYTRKMFFWDEVVAIWKSSVIVPVLMFFVISVLKISGDVSRFVIISSGFLSFLLFPYYRSYVKKFLRSQGIGVIPAIIVGAKEGGMSLFNALRKEQSSGYRIVAFVDDVVKGELEGLKVYNRIDKIERYINFSGIRDVFIVEADIGRGKTDILVKLLQHKVRRLIVVPEFQNLPVIGTDFHYFFYSQMFGIEIRNNLDNPFNIGLKAVFDFLIALILLPLFLFLSVFIMLAIIIDSPGNPMFTQIRVGKDGRLFKIYKFRTMYKDADKILEQYFQKKPAAIQEYKKYWKLKEDPRVTRVGKFLRKTSLDELPQILNVLKGEMSLIGPRPYLPHELDLVGDTKNIILKVKPGITGLWQVSGRSETDYTYRIFLDVWYVRNWSVWIDLIIMFKTLSKVIKREGAY